MDVEEIGSLEIQRGKLDEPQHQQVALANWIMDWQDLPCQSGPHQRQPHWDG
jgi:hypothetical protein